MTTKNDLYNYSKMSDNYVYVYDKLTDDKYKKIINLYTKYNWKLKKALDYYNIRLRDFKRRYNKEIGAHRLSDVPQYYNKDYLDIAINF